MGSHRRQKITNGWIAASPIAHRGLHTNRLPENSLGAFKAALEAGLAIELDIHLTSDGHLVIIHDSNSKRMTGRQLNILNSPLKNIQALRLQKTKYGIPTLLQTLEVIGGRVPIYIEIKTGTPASVIGPIVVNTLRSYNGPYAIMSFDPRIVSWFQKNEPAIPRGLISGTMNYPEAAHLNKPTKLLLRSMVSVLICKPNFLVYDIDAAPSKIMNFWCSMLKVPSLYATVRSFEMHKRAIGLGGNSIFESFDILKSSA